MLNCEQNGIDSPGVLRYGPLNRFRSPFYGCTAGILRQKLQTFPRPTTSRDPLHVLERRGALVPRWRGGSDFLFEVAPHESVLDLGLLRTTTPDEE
jgi:hypothetical protein